MIASGQVCPGMFDPALLVVPRPVDRQPPEYLVARHDSLYRLTSIAQMSVE
jgi:hypothetical protein